MHPLYRQMERAGVRMTGFADSIGLAQWNAALLPALPIP